MAEIANTSAAEVDVGEQRFTEWAADRDIQLNEAKLPQLVEQFFTGVTWPSDVDKQTIAAMKARVLVRVARRLGPISTDDMSDGGDEMGVRRTPKQAAQHRFVREVRNRAMQLLSTSKQSQRLQMVQAVCQQHVLSGATLASPATDFGKVLLDVDVDVRQLFIEHADIVHDAVEAYVNKSPTKHTHPLHPKLQMPQMDSEFEQPDHVSRKAGFADASLNAGKLHQRVCARVS